MDTHRNPLTGPFSWIPLTNKTLCLFWKAKSLLGSPENKGLDYSEANITGKGKARLLEKISFRHTFSLSLQRVVSERFIILNYHWIYIGNKSSQISTWNRKGERKKKKNTTEKVNSPVPGCILAYFFADVSKGFARNGLVMIADTFTLWFGLVFGVGAEHKGKKVKTSIFSPEIQGFTNTEL